MDITATARRWPAATIATASLLAGKRPATPVAGSLAAAITTAGITAIIATDTSTLLEGRRPSWHTRTARPIPLRTRSTRRGIRIITTTRTITTTSTTAAAISRFARSPAARRRCAATNKAVGSA